MRPNDKAISFVVMFLILILILFTLLPPAKAVSLYPGSLSSTSIKKGDTLVFSGVKLIIKSSERIPIDFLKFTVFRSGSNEYVTHVKFLLNGSEIEDPLNKFEVTLKYCSANLSSAYGYGYGYGYDEYLNEPQYHGYGYGYGGYLEVRYEIRYKTHVTGSFYAVFSVKSANHTYQSDKSSIFKVYQPSGAPANHPPYVPSKPSGPTHGYINQTLSFSTSTTDPDGNLIKYVFDWGDGTTYITDFYSSGDIATASHSWSQSGIYHVRVKAIDSRGAESDWSSSLEVNISYPTELHPPVAVIKSPDSALTNQTITFDASHSHDPDGNIVNYTWRFGDGTTGYGVKVNHSYSKSGNYTVVLTVMDNDGLSDSTSKRIDIKPDSDSDGWSDQEEQTYGTDPYNASSYPQDTDDDHVPDSVDTDDDNDGLIDDIEDIVGSDSKKETLYTRPTINGTLTYLVDTNDDGVYDVFYNPDTGIKTSVDFKNGKYRIDFDGDGKIDYIYDPVTGEVKPYEKVKPSFPIMIIISIIIVIAIILVVIYIYRKRM